MPGCAGWCVFPFLIHCPHHVTGLLWQRWHTAACDIMLNHKIHHTSVGFNQLLTRIGETMLTRCCASGHAAHGITWPDMSHRPWSTFDPQIGHKYIQTLRTGMHDAISSTNLQFFGRLLKPQWLESSRGHMTVMHSTFFTSF